MLALGSCLAGSGILIAGLLALLFQHPNAPWWTRPQLVPMLLCIPVAGLIGAGGRARTIGWLPERRARLPAIRP